MVDTPSTQAGESTPEAQAQDFVDSAPDPPAPRGRLKGKADAKVRVRRTAAEVAADKIALAQAKVDALRLQMEAKEAAKAANRRKPPRKPKPPPEPSESSEAEQQPPPRRKRAQVRDPSPESSDHGYFPPPASPRSRKQAMYFSWFR